jgi:hypothetical protein
MRSALRQKSAKMKAILGVAKNKKPALGRFNDAIWLWQNSE